MKRILVFYGLSFLFLSIGYPIRADNSAPPHQKDIVFIADRVGFKDSNSIILQVAHSTFFEAFETNPKPKKVTIEKIALGYRFGTNEYGRSFFDGKIEKRSFYGVDVTPFIGKQYKDGVLQASFGYSFEPFYRIRESDLVSLDYKLFIGQDYTLTDTGVDTRTKIGLFGWSLSLKDRYVFEINPYIGLTAGLDSGRLGWSVGSEFVAGIRF